MIWVCPNSWISIKNTLTRRLWGEWLKWHAVALPFTYLTPTCWFLVTRKQYRCLLCRDQNILQSWWGVEAHLLSPASGDTETPWTEQLWGFLALSVAIEESLKKMPKKPQNTVKVTKESLEDSFCCIRDMWQLKSDYGWYSKYLTTSSTQELILNGCWLSQGPDSWRPQVPWITPCTTSLMGEGVRVTQSGRCTGGRKLKAV